MSFNQILTSHSLGVSIAHAIERVFHQKDSSLMEPILWLFHANLLTAINILDPMLELFFSDLNLGLLIRVDLSVLFSQWYDIPDQVEMSRIPILVLASGTYAIFTFNSCELKLGRNRFRVLWFNLIILFVGIH